MIQNKAYIIGITGGIATGKTTVSNFLMEKGYRVIDADKVARSVVERGMPAYKAIVDEFGQSILKENKDIDRKALGNIVFKDEKQLKKLNNIVHSHVFIETRKMLERLSAEYDVIFLDIPLLFEVRQGLREAGILFNEIWLVYAGRNIQIERLIKRDGMPREDAISRIDSQMDIEEKKSLATEILHNSGTVEQLEQQLNELLKAL